MKTQGYVLRFEIKEEEWEKLKIVLGVTKHQSRALARKKALAVLDRLLEEKAEIQNPQLVWKDDLAAFYKPDQLSG